LLGVSGTTAFENYRVEVSLGGLAVQAPNISPSPPPSGLINQPLRGSAL